ncbi:PREDICTED: uncharacterized protein LOC106819320, partial [Priapulus caudatus]|uniref:Uncharacterized protein LOC106819320 n=1 Tax=Priapulus caudatus TaxID=37621 RepID=A0ABM1F4T3_PRICU
LIYTLRLQVFEVLTLALGIIVVMRKSHAPPSDDSKVEPPSAIARKALTNTVEQLLLCVICQGALATYLDEATMKLIPLLVTLFVFGRVTFYVGYLGAPPTRRAYGFAATYFPTVVTMFCCVYYAVARGPGYGLGGRGD